MDCNRARQLVDFARPGVHELDAADLVALEHHLADCPECGRTRRAERRDDQRIAKAMVAVPVPAELGTTLLRRLVAARTAWWRTRIVGAAAALTASALLVSVLYAQFGRPAIDPNAIAMSVYEQTGQGRSATEARSVANDWLRSIDRRLSAPLEWNYRLMTFTTQSDFAGLSSVPTLVFARGDAGARIYVVREAALQNLASLDQPVEHGGCTIASRRYPGMIGWVFIIVTNGGPVDLFLRPVESSDPA